MGGKVPTMVGKRKRTKAKPERIPKPNGRPRIPLIAVVDQELPNGYKDYLPRRHVHFPDPVLHFRLRACCRSLGIDDNFASGIRYVVREFVEQYRQEHTNEYLAAAQNLRDELNGGAQSGQFFFD